MLSTQTKNDQLTVRKHKKIKTKKKHFGSKPIEIESILYSRYGDVQQFLIEKEKKKKKQLKIYRFFGKKQT